MRVAIDARLAGPGLGIGQFATRLARALVARGDIEVIWLGELPEPLANVRAVPLFGRLPYPVLDSAVTARAIRRLGADLIHFPGNTGWRRRATLPALLTVHDLIFTRSGGAGRPRQRLGHRYERHTVPRAVRAATRVVAVSEATAADIRRVGWRPDVHVIRHGATTAVASGAARVDREAPYLVAFAGRDPRKATDLVVAAFRRLRGRVARLDLLASGGLPEGFAQMAGDLVAGGEVVVHPRLDRAELDALVQRATALVYPSRDEGFGLPVLDGMTLGVPVVTGLCAATREVGGDAVLTIDPAAPAQSIAEAVERLLRDPDLSDALAERGRRRAAGYSWEEAARQYVGAYRAVTA